MKLLLAAVLSLPLAAQNMVVYKTPTCGCCGKWVDHMKTAGFRVTVNEVANTAPIRARHGVKDAYASCHTAVVGGYVIEGHVPAADIRRLLKQKPKARGLAVPGMPMGSPGMEGPYQDAYSVLLLTEEGSSSWQRYAGSR
jgi:hypothetical protein